ncbi:MAG: CAAD domain-containing protein [Leptolyngbyaceae cyanobacterium bins.59]|nr:CAAD domain-containing protein [Leptolyngbyaceae cyanobacterium bins.59]
MNPELQQSEYSDATDANKQVVDINTSGASVSRLSSTSDSGQWQQIGAQALDFFSDLASYVGVFIKEKPLVSFGLFLLAALSVKLTLAVLDALNDIPLVSPTFELIGIAYATWFTTRYLWKASSRDELIGQIQSLKKQILGDKAD